jgi:hypothetical protein
MLQRGTAAEELLANEAFIVVVNELYNQRFAEITGSDIGDMKKREQCFLQIRAMQDISTELRSWVHAKDQLLSQPEE